ncbi:uncharacterized protein [Anabrus simplex]|uniref:uncharacterized protein n=1 Tax=Anabrus simplex TaxID=316456 RepID=UPI0035A3321E
MNFSPFGGHFPTVHQFATAKFNSEQIHPGTMLVTSASDGTIQYIRPEHNGANFIATSGNNNPVQAIPVTLTTTLNIPVSAARALNPMQTQHQQPNPPPSPQQQQQQQQQHHHHQHALAAVVNQNPGTAKYHHPSGAILSWADVPVMHHFSNDANKNIATINVPYPAQAMNSTATILAVQSTQTVATPSVWPVRLMQSVSTMTVDESELQPQDLCKPENDANKSKDDVSKESDLKREVKDSGESEDESDDSSKSDMEGPSSTSEAETQRTTIQIPVKTLPNGNLECHQIQLQQQGSAMADYLARLPASTLPLSLQHFLKYQAENVVGTNIAIKREDDNNISGVLLGGAAITPINNLNSGLDSPKKKKKKKISKKPPRPRPGEIRLSTALDGSTLFCCPECHMAYPDRDLLEQHLAGHKLERRFVCNVCGAGLKRKEHLDQHKRGHSDERPFVCTVCLKGFKRNEHLTRHYVIHSGCKSHACSECGKKFSRKDHLHKHTQTHIAKRVKAEMSQAGQENGTIASGILQPSIIPQPPTLHHTMVHPLQIHHALS